MRLMCTPAPSVAGTPDVILETARNLMPDFELLMKSVLLLATVVLGQSLSSAMGEEGNADDGIMPEMALQTGEFKASYTVRELLCETSARQYERIIPPDEAIGRPFRGFQSAGVEHSKLMVIRNMSRSNPKRRDLKNAIEYLDSHDAD